MSRKGRSRTESGRDRFPIFVAGGGEQISRHVSREKALCLEQAGAVRREFCSVSGALIGFRVVGLENRRVDTELRTTHSSTSIDRREMICNIERSRTHGLPELERAARIANGQPPEDRAERVQAKVRVYAIIGASKGDILRVWPR